MRGSFNWELQYVVFALGPQWNVQAAELERALCGEGIRCVQIRKDGFSEEEINRARIQKNDLADTGTTGAGTIYFHEEKIQNMAAFDFRLSGAAAHTSQIPGTAADTLILTDDPTYSAAMAARGWTVIGCTRGASFFDGAVLTTGAPEELDAQCLEEYLLHAQGRPVTAARTERLILREIAPEDFDALYRISRQPEMEYAFPRHAGRFFERDSLSSYIKYAYRFYGYGLWSVKTAAGELAGCCGFSEWNPADMAAKKSQTSEKPAVGQTTFFAQALADAQITASVQSVTSGQSMTSGQENYAVLDDQQSSLPRREQRRALPRLELQYMLDRKFQGRGYGLEMCRAALRYAFARTDWDEVWVRIHPQNRASLRLAGRLGFADCGERADEMLVLRKKLKEL